MEKLPRSEDRDNYLQKRREERGRPPLNLYLLRRHGQMLHGNLKDDWEDEVPDWQEQDQVSDYHTFVRTFPATEPVALSTLTDPLVEYPLW